MYSTFDELRLYALKRANGSARRGDPQAFEYWATTSRWAETMLAVDDDQQLQRELNQEIAITLNEAHPLAVRANAHARAIHLRRMLRARGYATPRLSLDWLRAAASDLDLVYIKLPW